MRNTQYVAGAGTVFTALSTWRDRSQFSYRYGGALSLRYGNGRQLSVSAEKMRQLRTAHRGQIIAAFGASGSLDAWASAHITPTRIVSYLAPALIDLGFAERTGDKIRFLD